MHSEHVLMMDDNANLYFLIRCFVTLLEGRPIEVHDTRYPRLLYLPFPPLQRYLYLNIISLTRTPLYLIHHLHPSGTPFPLCCFLSNSPTKSSTASHGTPLLMPVSSSQLECKPTSAPVLRSTSPAPLWPQYVQQVCASAPISRLSCGSWPAAMPRNVPVLSTSVS